MLVLKKGFPLDKPSAPVRGLVDSLGLRKSVKIIEDRWEYAEMARLFRISDVFVTIPQPAKDGLAQSLLDAVASGCLPIVSANPDTLEVIGPDKVRATVIRDCASASEVSAALSSALEMPDLQCHSVSDANRAFIQRSFERSLCVRLLGSEIDRVLSELPLRAGPTHADDSLSERAGSSSFPSQPPNVRCQ